MVFWIVSVCCQGVVSGFECGVSVPSGVCCVMVFWMVSVRCQSVVSGFRCVMVFWVVFSVLPGCCEWFWCGFVSVPSGFWCVMVFWVVFSVLLGFCEWFLVCYGVLSGFQCVVSGFECGVSVPSGFWCGFVSVPSGFWCVMVFWVVFSVLLGFCEWFLVCYGVLSGF